MDICNNYYKLVVLGCALSLAVALQAKPDTHKKIAVTVEKVKKESFQEVIEALGNLKANETTILTTSITETVKAIHFTDSQVVKKGQILVEMTSLEEVAQMISAKAEVKEAEQQYNRARSLTRTGAISKSILDERKRQIDTARAKKQEILSKMHDRQIVAPFDGQLGLRQISVGSLIKPGDAIITINDSSKVKLDFAVPTIFLSKIKIGLPIIATSKSYQNREFKGEVVSIDNTIDSVTRSILVRAIIPNTENLLKPGLLMNVRLVHNARLSLKLPEEALIQNGKKYYVFVINEKNNSVSKREITIGSRKLGAVEVKSGLSENEQVVAHGGFKLAEGNKIEIINDIKQTAP